MLGRGMSAALGALLTLTLGAEAPADELPTIYRHDARTGAGEDVSLERYRGEVLLIVNTASRCGFTPQYEGLEALHRRYAERGFQVLAFPSNDFGGQEPGTDEEIRLFCEERYDVTFPLFAKVKVRGEDRHPLFADLAGGATNPGVTGGPRWNFTKWLVGRDGRVIARFGSTTAPDSGRLGRAIEQALRAERPASGGGGGEEARAAGQERVYRTARYFPLAVDSTYVYSKRIARRFGGHAEELARRPVTRTQEGRPVLRLEDSEGEYQTYTLVDGAPAMGAQSMRAQGFEQSYSPPVPLFPAEARVGETQRYSSEVLHQTRRSIRRGTIERAVTLEAVETVVTPAGSFPGCLRFRARTENRPERGGSFAARLDETVWLAPGVGEVKSVQRVRLETWGVAWMKATLTYELKAPKAAAPARPVASF